MSTQKKPETIRRFPFIRCIEHALAVLVFFGLVATGLPQKFHNQTWAIWMVKAVGGIQEMRFIHRVFGAIFAFQFVMHMCMGFWIIWVQKKIPAIVPNLKDVKDIWHSLAHSLNWVNHGPKFGRFDWKQKFEYWGLIVGGSLMIFTGITLWMPSRVATFLPADVIPISKVAHSNEAFLAFMVITFWHLYSVIFSPEVFPLDRTMLTGRISKERMHHEHPLELEEILKAEEKKNETQQS